MKKMLLLLLVVVLMLGVSACGKSWICCECGKEFSGAAYEDGFTDGVLCQPCAKEYYWPLPYKQFKK